MDSPVCDVQLTDLEPEKKKPRVMDSPIYVRVTDFRGYRWYAIEEKSKVTDELEEEYRGIKSDEDMVRELGLPPVGHYFEGGCFTVAKSRIFLIGGCYDPRQIELDCYDADDVELVWKRFPNWLLIPEWNIIRSIDIEEEKENRKWKIMAAGEGIEGEVWKTIKGDFDQNKFIIQAVAYGDWIYCIGQGKLFKFSCNDVNNLAVVMEVGFEKYARMLAVTETKIFIFFRNFRRPKTEPGGDEFGYYDLKSKSLVLLDRFVRWPDPVPITAVVVRDDSYLIIFGLDNPLTKVFKPYFYVYDIKLHKWLPDSAVQGLEIGDGITFPIQDKYDVEYEDVQDTSLVLVRGNENDLKLALIWTTPATHLERQNTCVHWSKFKLSIHDDHNSPTFHFEALSSGSYYTEQSYCAPICTIAG